MKRNLFLMSFGFGALLLAANHAHAQPRNCADRATVVARLAEHYGESRQSTGLGHDNTLIELFASMDTGSWTITVTTYGGPTCLVAAGQAFQQLHDTLPAINRGA